MDEIQKNRNEIVRKKIFDVEEIKIGKYPMDSPWVKPVRICYKQDGKEKVWDVVKSHDSVGIVVFNITRKKLILVRQFRPAAYYACLPDKIDKIDLKKYPPSLGVTLELCAGIVDKDKPLVEIARDELREECGYEAPASAFKEIVTYRGVGSGATKQTLFYVEVTDDMHTHPGGGAECEGELIELVEMNIEEAENYITSGEVQSPSSFLFGISWFLCNKRGH
ncbi:PREDICTED: uridine diphosphate glucose pyrophosphatase-like [Polistes canadensis]|uniref:uridine diphosphate glucose pyrophosphatase-like n=1 Tax=Polistes canadensis TaxID=91411 RepID=UPI000718D313|nr:PREDICTED: uridine diphosphate glucose pyrophosphatase-like [Polistes canadensis]